MKKSKKKPKLFKFHLTKSNSQIFDHITVEPSNGVITLYFENNNKNTEKLSLTFLRYFMCTASCTVSPNDKFQIVKSSGDIHKLIDHANSAEQKHTHLQFTGRLSPGILSCFIDSLMHYQLNKSPELIYLLYPNMSMIQEKSDLQAIKRQYRKFLKRTDKKDSSAHDSTFHDNTLTLWQPQNLQCHNPSFPQPLNMEMLNNNIVRNGFIFALACNAYLTESANPGFGMSNSELSSSTFFNLITNLTIILPIICLAISIIKKCLMHNNDVRQPRL